MGNLGIWVGQTSAGEEDKCNELLCLSFPLAQNGKIPIPSCLYTFNAFRHA